MSRKRKPRAAAPEVKRRAPAAPASGYSGTGLPSKLGIKVGSSVLALCAPAAFSRALGELPPQAQLCARGKGPFDIAVVFCMTLRELSERFNAASAAVGDRGRLWVAWPKKSSGVRSELTEDAIRAACLPSGWVDYKVCAIDATWSGLCFGRRRT